MRLKQLLHNMRHPPADCMVGYMTRSDGASMRTVPFVMLIHLIWLFLWPLLQRESFARVILPTLISVIPFLYFHLCTYFYGGPHNRRMRYVAGYFLIAFLVTPFNVSGMGYLIFGFFALCFTLPIRIAWRVILGTMGLYAIELRFLSLDTQAMLSVLIPLVIFGIIAVYTGYTTSQAAILKRSKEEIMRLATLAERERIGRDLHDLLGHTLSVVALKSELARKLIDRDLEAARSEIGEVERVARDALQQVRTAVSGIRSTALNAELLSATALLESQGLRVQCETEHVKLPHDRETALALSLREATTNIGRHARATGVVIRVKKESAAVIVEVADNGRGGTIVPGNGLNGMRERLASVGGSLSLIPNKEGGILLRAAVPVAA
jgi:two-component system sensor histidine kinase DesK